MANFGPNVTEQPAVSTARTVKQPVQPAPANNTLLTVFDMATQVGGKVLEKRAEEKTNQALIDFTNEQMRVLESARQGILSRDQAQTRLNANFMKAASANPSLQEDYMRINSQIRGAGGGGSFLNDKTQDERNQEFVWQTGLSEGWLTGDETDEQANSIFRQRQSVQLQIKAMDDRIKELQLIGAERNLTLAEREEMQYLGKQQLVESTQVNVQEFDANIKRITQMRDEEGNLLSTADRRELLNNLWQTFQTEVQPQLAAIEDPEFAKAYLKTFELLYQRADDLINNKISNETFEAEIKGLSLAAQRRLINDPYFQELLGANDLFSENMTSITGSISSVKWIEHINKVLKAEEPVEVVNPDAAKAVKVVGDLEPEEGTKAAEEQQKAIEHVFGSLGDSEAAMAAHPERLKDLMTYFSGTRFYKVRTRYQLDPEQVERGLRAVASVYESEVANMIKREFTNSNVVSPNALNSAAGGLGGSFEELVPTPNAIGYQSSPEGVRFYAADSTSDAAIKEAKRLNESLAPVINKMVRAFSHLEGHTNYQQRFDSMAEVIFSGASLDNTPENDLSIDDFLSGISGVVPLPDEDITSHIGMIPGRAWKQRPMDNVEGMIIHHTGGRGEVSGVIDTLVRRGLSAHFVVDRQGKVHQLMPEFQMAWHAGVRNKSKYRNHNTIGVEVIANDDNDVLPIQVEVTKRLIKSMSERYGFDPTVGVHGHGEVAPGHKQATEGKTVVESVRK